MLCAAGSLPGDLHKLWRTRDPKGYHLEYGYSCMGYEIAGGLGVKMAEPEREVYVMVGDGSYLMMTQRDRDDGAGRHQADHRRARQPRLRQHRRAVARASAATGSAPGTASAPHSDELDGEMLPVDFAANAASLGAHVIRARNRDELADAIAQAQRHEGGPVCIVIETDRSQRVGGYESWWDVAVAEVSDNPEVEAARQQYEEAKRNERYFL